MRVSRTGCTGTRPRRDCGTAGIDDQRTRPVGEDHDALAVEPVVEDAGGGGEELHSLQDKREGDALGAAGELQQQHRWQPCKAESPISLTICASQSRRKFRLVRNSHAESETCLSFIARSVAFRPAVFLWKERLRSLSYAMKPAAAPNHPLRRRSKSPRRRRRRNHPLRRRSKSPRRRFGPATPTHPLRRRTMEVPSETRLRRRRPGAGAGRVVLTPFTLPGEQVRVALQQEKSDVAYGRLLSVLFSGPRTGRAAVSLFHALRRVPLSRVVRV